MRRNKPKGRFKTIEEAAKYKTDLVEEIFAKVNRKILESLVNRFL